MGNCCDQHLAGHAGDDNEVPEWSSRDPCREDSAVCQVKVNIYDLNESLIGTNILACDLLHVGGAFHAGVEINGTEWSYGSEGIFSGKPKINEYHKYRQTLHMGSTELTSKEIKQLLLELRPRWAGKQYDMLNKNCCSFSDQFCIELGVGPMPHWVNRLARMGSVILTAASAPENFIGASAGSVSARSGSRVRPDPLSLEFDDLEELDEALNPTPFKPSSRSKATTCTPKMQKLADFHGRGVSQPKQCQRDYRMRTGRARC